MPIDETLITTDNLIGALAAADLGSVRRVALCGTSRPHILTFDCLSTFIPSYMFRIRDME